MPSVVQGLVQCEILASIRDLKAQKFHCFALLGQCCKFFTTDVRQLWSSPRRCHVSFCRLQFLSFLVTVYTTETKAAETPKCGWLNNTPSPINTWRYSSNLAIKIALPLILFPMTYELATHFSRSAKQEGEMSEPNSLRYEQGIENNLMECRCLYAGTFADVTL